MAAWHRIPRPPGAAAARHAAPDRDRLFLPGSITSFTPFFGLHFFVAAGLARLLRGNMIAGLIGTAVGNPLTFPLIASVSLGLGRRIVGYGVTGRDFSRVSEAFGQAFSGIWQSLLSLFGRGDSEWSKLVPFFRDIVLPYFLGGILPGLVASVAAYYLVRPIVAAYQMRRRHRMLTRARERLAKSEADAARRRSYKPGTSGAAESEVGP